MILTETGKNLDREGCIQTYVRQASIALKRAVAENTLKKSEELFSNIAEHSPLAIAIIDPSGRYSYINQNFSRIFGYTLQDFQTGREWFLLAFPDSHYRKKVIADWKKDLGCTAIGVPRSRAYTVRCRDGGEKEIFFRLVLLSDGKQCIVYEDITERRDTERTRKLLASIVESTDDAIIGKTSQGFIISWNSAAERLYGYSRDEIIGRNISVIVPHEKLGELDEIMKKISRGTGFSNLLTRRIRKDGSVIDVGITISPIIEDDGRIIGVSTISRDITAEKAEERLRNSENKYRTQVENLTVGVYRSTGDPKGRFVWGNPTLVEILGYSSLEDLREVDVADIFSGITPGNVAYPDALIKYYLFDYTLLHDYRSSTLSNTHVNDYQPSNSQSGKQTYSISVSLPLSISASWSFQQDDYSRYDLSDMAQKFAKWKYNANSAAARESSAKTTPGSSAYYTKPSSGTYNFVTVTDSAHICTGDDTCLIDHTTKLSYVVDVQVP